MYVLPDRRCLPEVVVGVADVADVVVRIPPLHH